MKKAPWLYGLFLGLAVVATARFAPSKPTIARLTAPSRPAVARVSAAPTTVDETWTIPGVGLTPGLNDTRFVSDLAITNLGVVPATVTLSFIGPGGLPPQSGTIAAGATTTYRNVIDALWDITGVVGALSVQSDQPLVLRARTYNTAATGTFGVSLPVYSSDHLIGEGQTADSLWVQQDSSSNSGFRTNVGVVFPDAGGGEAVVTLYDAAGVVVGTMNYSSASAGFQQQSVASAAPAGLPIGRAQIFVTRGHAAGYAVGVDNVTGDTSLYPLEALPAGVQDVVVNGVARLNGRNNTFFRTDARFYNPTLNDVTVTARFHAAGQSNPTPQSATTTVPAGRIIQVVDLLGSVLNAPVGSGGAVRFTADAPVAILCRTSNVDPQGLQPGTFGAQQRPVPLASFLSSADAGAVVTAIRQDSSFRTNIGFTAGPDGATYGMTLKSAAGATIAGAVGNLGAFGWTQASVADLFPGTAVPADATLVVTVASGTVDVYDASLDNASGDLVVTPIAPIPAAIPASASIGPSGGSIRSADGRLTLKVPAGALAAPTTLSIAPVANGAPNAIGSGYAISPVGVAFARPAQLVLAYFESDLGGTGTGALGLASQDGTTWYGIQGGSIDPVARTLFVSVPSTSPRPASASRGRVPQRATANGNLGPYGSVTLNPAEHSVVEEETVQLGLIYVGPSSTQTLGYGLVPLFSSVSTDPITHWSVQQYFLDPVGTLATDGQQLNVYTAPRCTPRRENPVYVTVRVEVGHWTAHVAARILVIPRRWFIDLFYRSKSLCPGPAFSVEFCRSHEGGAFGIRNGQVNPYQAGTIHHHGSDASAWCPGFGAGCSQTSLSTIAELNITSVLGGLVGQNTLNPVFHLGLSVDHPGVGAYVSFTCGGGGFQLPIIQQPETQVALDVEIPYRPNATLTWTDTIHIPFTEEPVELILRPIYCDNTTPPLQSSCN